MKSKPKCSDVFRHICDNLDADLNSPACREIRKHIDGCPDCSACLDSVKRTVLLYRALPAPTVPKSAHHTLFKTITLAQGGKSRGVLRRNHRH